MAVVVLATAAVEPFTTVLRLVRQHQLVRLYPTSVETQFT